jgi:hypothetical protein
LEEGVEAEEMTRRRRGRDNAFNYCGVLWRDEKENSSRTNERNTRLRIQIDANEQTFPLSLLTLLYRGLLFSPLMRT